MADRTFTLTRRAAAHKLSCKDTHGDGWEIKAGTSENEHLVSIEPHGSGTRFGTVLVQTHGKERHAVGVTVRYSPFALRFCVVPFLVAVKGSAKAIAWSQKSKSNSTERRAKSDKRPLWLRCEPSPGNFRLVEHPCYRCQALIDEGIAFCPHCGAPQIRVVPPEENMPATPPPGHSRRIPFRDAAGPHRGPNAACLMRRSTQSSGTWRGKAHCWPEPALPSYRHSFRLARLLSVDAGRRCAIRRALPAPGAGHLITPGMGMKLGALAGVFAFVDQRIRDHAIVRGIPLEQRFPQRPAGADGKTDGQQSRSQGAGNHAANV